MSGILFLNNMIIVHVKNSQKVNSKYKSRKKNRMCIIHSNLLKEKIHSKRESENCQNNSKLRYMMSRDIKISQEKLQNFD